MPFIAVIISDPESVTRRFTTSDERNECETVTYLRQRSNCQLASLKLFKNRLWRNPGHKFLLWRNENNLKIMSREHEDEVSPQV